MNDEQQIIEPVPTMAGYKKIPTFKLWIANQFPYIETDFDAITNYELLQAVIKYLNTIIENENNVESNVTALYNAFVNLHDYVTNYFDNLDVQEEVNNKLDEMVKDGTLESLLLNYTQVSKVFDTYNDMMLDTSTYVNGMKLKTLGYHYVNDGGGAEYFVTNVQNTNKYQVSIGTNLWIELIIKDNTLHIKQIGAYGDNVNDDYNIFSSAINFINGKYMTLFIDEGTYYLSQKLIINWSNSNYWIDFNGSYKIKGSGQFTSILRFSGKDGIDTTHTGIVALEMSDFSIENLEYKAIETTGGERKPDASKGIGLLLSHLGYVAKISNIGVSGFYIGIATRDCYCGPMMSNLFTKNCVFGYSSKSDTSTMISNSSFFGLESCYIQEGSLSSLTNIICEGTLDRFMNNNYNQRTKFKGRGFSFYSASSNLIGCYTERLFGNSRYYENMCHINEVGGNFLGGTYLYADSHTDELTEWLTNNPDYKYCAVEDYLNSTADLQKNFVNIQNPEALGTGFKIHTNQTVTDEFYSNFVVDGVDSYQGIDNTLNKFYLGNLKPIVNVRTTSSPFKIPNFISSPQKFVGPFNITGIGDKTNAYGPNILVTSRKANFTDTSYNETRLRLVQTLSGGAKIYLETYLDDTKVSSKEIISIASDGKVTFPQN